MNATPDWLRDVHSPLDDRLGVVITELSPERVVGSMPVDGNQQPFGLLHGGASGVLVETLASMGAMAHGYPDRVGVGVDLNVTHVRAARAGHVTGTATAIHLGRSIATYRVDIVDDKGRLTATGRLTCHMIPARPAP
ncbi:aromatic compound degradation protein PaaI [Tessaracoccus lapidicaptus]|uniref:Aromatic compound degradation protein PaaI n=1 Tax=Tessaracoccus lapidicaptus TaxID=1427523 RepID=A0A1C0AI59_9ACTN|nr:PaaI family thioesterase [Tessaracoccus lapidicaptus]OCL31708.1 aromatic compound degradation protein PaaI [Tessaracoccus lapidicaptus]